MPKGFLEAVGSGGLGLGSRPGAGEEMHRAGCCWEGEAGGRGREGPRAPFFMPATPPQTFRRPPTLTQRVAVATVG